MIASFALAFLIAASLGQRLNVAALAVGSAVVLTAATVLSGALAGVVALVGMQAGYLAGHAALVIEGHAPQSKAARRR